MPWRRAAEVVSRRHGFPPNWVELFAEQEEAPSDPRKAVRSFESWALRRLAQVWAGKESEPDLDGTLAVYLVQRYLADSARVLAYRYKLSGEEWEDLVASAGLRALRVFSERYIEAPQPYLYRTVERAAWEYLRKARREVSTDVMPTSADSRPDPARQAAWREIFDTFMKNCYRSLSDDDRALLEALEIEGLSAAEAGEPLGLTANAVNVRKFRIRQRLMDCLRKQTGLENPLESL